MNVRKQLEKNISVIALVMALILGGVVMLICGYNPLEAYGSILKGAFIGKKAICQTLVQATPLVLAGLAYSVAKKANLINLGISPAFNSNPIRSNSVRPFSLSVISFTFITI